MALVARTLDEHPTLPGSLNETADRCRQLDAEAALIVADLVDESDRARVVPEATAALGGPIDILVNNAAGRSTSRWRTTR